MNTLSAVLLLVASISASGAEPVLSDFGYGSVEFGSLLRDVEKLLGERVAPVTHPDENHCRYVTFKSLPGVDFMVEEGVITRAESTMAIRTSVNVSVGATLVEARSRLRMLEIQPHHYDDSGHYLILRSKDKKCAILFEESEGKITNVRAGLVPAVEYVEGCL